MEDPIKQERTWDSDYEFDEYKIPITDEQLDTSQRRESHLIKTENHVHDNEVTTNIKIDLSKDFMKPVEHNKRDTMKLEDCSDEADNLKVEQTHHSVDITELYKNEFCEEMHEENVIGEAFNLRFVGEVEKHPEIYNYTLETYSNKDATEKAWNNVAKVVNLSVNECKEKWRNLRSTFAKYLEPIPTGSGAIKKKPYYLMESMQFAIPFIKGAGTPTGNLISETSQTMLPLSSPTSDITENTDEGDQDLAEEVSNDLVINSPPATFPLLISTPSSSACYGDRVGDTQPWDTTAEKRAPHGQPIRKKILPQNDTADKSVASNFMAKQQRMSNPPLQKDGRDKREEGIQNFVMSLVPDLMQLNDVQLRHYKRKSLLLIDEVMDMPFNYPDSVTSDRGVVLPPNDQGSTSLVDPNHILQSAPNEMEGTSETVTGVSQT